MKPTTEEPAGKMKANRSSKILMLLVATFITIIVLGLLTPTLLGYSKTAYKSKTINNIKQIAIALNEFDSKYDSYPQKELPEDLRAEYQQQDRDDSNYLLGHLIRSKCTDTEKIFVGNHGKGSEPDDIFTPDQEILRAGECEFSYISASFPQSSTPILFAHLLNGTNRFESEFYNDTMIYLRGDSSVGTRKVNSDGKAFPKGSQKDFFATGPGTLWPDDAPKIHHPLPYPIRSAPKHNISKLTKLATFLILASGPITYYLLLRLSAFSRNRTLPSHEAESTTNG